MGYDGVVIPDEASLVANLRRQLKKHNDVQLSDAEFAKALNHLDKPKILERQNVVNDFIGKILVFIETFEDGIGEV